MKKKLLCVLLAVCMIVPCCVAFASCKKDPTGVYTYHSYSSALGTNWNPHTWEMNADDSILEQISLGFVDPIYFADGEYEWHYEMATEIKDITASASAADKEKWGIGNGATGRMWKISLNPNAKWDNGDVINADSYVESMKLLLDPTLKNYRANSYYSNDFEIVGAREYYSQGLGWFAADEVHDSYDASLDSSLILKLGPINSKGSLQDKVTCSFRAAYGTGDYANYGLLSTQTAGEFMEAVNAVFGDSGCTAADIDAIEGKTLADIKANATLKATLDKLIEWWDEGEDGVLAFTITSMESPAVDFAKVGLYKTGEYEIVYVCANEVAEFDFMVNCASASWLVHKETYENAITTANGIKACKYNTSLETTRSYGPYKIESYQADKQIVYVQNENWYGWEAKRGKNGELVSHITIKDGEHRQFQTTKIIVDVMTDEAAKQAFLKGDLDDLALDNDDIPTYATSDRLSKVDETYTMRFFFNLEATEALDKGNNNKNSVVLTNAKFREAFSLAINREELNNTATAGYKPAFSLLNTLYYYNVAKDPASIYRTSEWGMKTVVELYDIEYGAGKTYATLEEAYNAVTGYDLTKAKALMKQACTELVAAGKYTAGQEIKIQVGFCKPALTATDEKHQLLVNQYLNAAAEGSGFGKITLEYVGNLENRYEAVQEGSYAIGYGAWGGAAFYPFKMFEVYLEPDQLGGMGVHECGCFDPVTESMTIESFQYVDSNGATKTFPTTTKTWEKWSQAIKTGGEFDLADINLKLALLSRIEKAYIQQYYVIPLSGTTVVSLLGYKIENITEEYSVMYGFGGIRFTSFNFTDAEWTRFVKKNAKSGTLTY